MWIQTRRKEGSEFTGRLSPMNATAHIVEPDRRVLKGRGYGIQEDADRHPFVVPDPEGILHRIRIEAADVAQMIWEFIFERHKVPFLFEELCPFSVVSALMKMPELMHKGLVGQGGGRLWQANDIRWPCVGHATVRGRHERYYSGSQLVQCRRNGKTLNTFSENVSVTQREPIGRIVHGFSAPNIRAILPTGQLIAVLLLRRRKSGRPFGSDHHMK